MDFNEELDEDMTVEITLDDSTTVVCPIIKILTVGEKDYIALKHILDEETDDYEVWFYGYSENPDDPNEEPVLTYIEDEEEYDAVEDAYDEFLDNCDFDEM